MNNPIHHAYTFSSLSLVFYPHTHTSGGLSNPWAVNRVRPRPGPENRNTQIPVEALSKLEAVSRLRNYRFNRDACVGKSLVLWIKLQRSITKKKRMTAIRPFSFVRTDYTDNICNHLAGRAVAGRAYRPPVPYHRGQGPICRAHRLNIASGAVRKTIPAHPRLSGTASRGLYCFFL